MRENAKTIDAADMWVINGDRVFFHSCKENNTHDWWKRNVQNWKRFTYESRFEMKPSLLCLSLWNSENQQQLQASISIEFLFWQIKFFNKFRADQKIIKKERAMKIRPFTSNRPRESSTYHCHVFARNHLYSFSRKKKRKAASELPFCIMQCVRSLRRNMFRPFFIDY